MHVREIMEALTRLTKPELDQVATAIRALGGKSASERKPRDPTEADKAGALFLEEMGHALRRAGIEFRSMDSHQRSALYPSFRDKAHDLLTEYLKDMQRVERHGIISLGMDLLIAELRCYSDGAGSNKVMSHIHRIPDIIDQNFPGYAEAGLLPLIINRDRIKEHT